MTTVDAPLAVILFDMDGTLLDLSFDNLIWLHEVPKLWAAQNACSVETAQVHLSAFYHAHHGTLNWYSSRFWQAQLGIDVLDVQRQHQQLIKTRPLCFEVLQQLQQRDIACWLVTNADEATLALKLENVALRPYFNLIVSSETVGAPKEQPQFWQYLVDHYHLQPSRAWLIDDNAQVLTCARRFGIARQYGVLQPDSTLPAQQFAHDVCDRELMALTDVLLDLV